VTQFQLRRVNLEPFIRSGQERGDSQERWPHLWGDLGWLANVPNVFQALANPEGTHDFAQAPRPNGPMELAYWESLLFLLVHSFGWRSPAHGLQWWHDAGRPCDDDRFALIAQTWLADGFLRWFEAWVQHRGFGPAGEHASSGGLPLPVPETELERLAMTARYLALRLPEGASSDSHHLTLHLFNDWGGPEHNELILDSDGGPRGVLLTERVDSFRAFLHQAAALKHEHPSGRSWRIDVICKQIGWLGTYRRSRVTGYWFAGKHSIHMAGHPAKQAD